MQEGGYSKLDSFMAWFTSHTDYIYKIRRFVTQKTLLRMHFNLAYQFSIILHLPLAPFEMLQYFPPGNEKRGTFSRERALSNYYRSSSKLCNR